MMGFLDKEKIDMYEYHQCAKEWLIKKVMTQEIILQQEQQTLLVSQSIFNQSLSLYYQISQLKAFPPRLLKEFFFAIQSKDMEVIFLLKKKIDYLLHKLLKP